MSLKEWLLHIIPITIVIGISSVSAWSPEAHRYESYDLDRGPVFYEAYYPDGNDESRGNYQEKQFFDQDAVLEKTYQIPSQHLVYPEGGIRMGNPQSPPGNPLQEVRQAAQTRDQPLDIKELSNLARRAISRDLENWNTLENYLDRTKYQDSTYRRRMIVPEPSYGIEESNRGIGIGLRDTFKDRRDFDRNLYEEVREEPFQRVPEAMRRLAARDLTGRNALENFGSVRYQAGQAQRAEGVQRIEDNIPLMKDAQGQRVVEPFPSENIFAPRPQVINYIFSKKPTGNTKNQIGSEMKETMVEPKEESIPRSYGDNLIQDEVKKEEAKDVKIASIEVSEVPRHKTRHHHGEWPKRDYSKRHQ
ncbi:uncharacterized protein LOC143210946 [Lasioglossum baleicum]|uniref:uncharacterized protein LOC143210946 n=1 Tax=Lasioglossum baleicum TaxID=434251 RepID=UPI003FCE1B98